MIRLVLLLLLVQFVTPAFAHVGTSDTSIHEKNSFKPQQTAGITISIFLKEISEEKNEAEGKANVSLKIIDFTFHEIVLKQLHAQVLWDINNAQPPSSPLFKLYCVFLI